jgi:hypothetical protein
MPTDFEMDARELAQRQYGLGLLNRRLAIHMARLDDIFARATGDHGLLTLLCACGREDCDQPLLTISTEDYERVRESPHRFIVFPDHTTEIDEIIYVGEGFAIVEIKPQYREEKPVTADADAPP